MKWIEFLEDRGSFKKGQRIEKEDAAAKDLIDLGIAKAATAPETEPVDAAKGVIAAAISSAVADGIAQLKKDLEPVTKRLQHPKDNEADEGYVPGSTMKMVVPATVRRYGSLKAFTGPNAERKAFSFGMFCMAIYGKAYGRQYCQKNGIDFIEASTMTKVAQENLNSDAGYLVQPEWGTTIIDLREQYGIARQLCNVVPMASDTRTDPRRRDGIATYFVGESQAMTQADMTWDSIQLTAKKLSGLTKISSELGEDAMIDYGDKLANEFAYGFALKEDQCLFLGDGTSTYGGMVGLKQAFANLSGTPTNIYGATQGAAGTGASWGFVLSDFNKVNAKLPQYADEGNVTWVCSRAFWGQEMQRLAMAAGGNRISDIENGARQKSFAGYPVLVSQVMPRTPANTDIPAYFGDFKKAVSFGTRREITLGMSNAALSSFEQDQLALRATERFHIVVHEVGDLTTGTARSAQAGLSSGPVVPLYTASS